MSSNKSALLILYLCFTSALLTLLQTGTALTSMSSKKSEKQNEEIEDMMDQTSTLIKVFALLLLYSCFTSALLVLYACFTRALRMLYSCFTLVSRRNKMEKDKRI